MEIVGEDFGYFFSFCRAFYFACLSFDKNSQNHVVCAVGVTYYWSSERHSEHSKLCNSVVNHHLRDNNHCLFIECWVIES